MNIHFLPTLTAVLFGASLMVVPSASALDLLSTGSDEKQAKTDSSHPSVSGDGRYVVFETRAALVSADTNGVIDIYLKDRVTRTVTLVSQNNGGEVGNALSIDATISAEGGHVVFLSGATNFSAGDSNRGFDVFVRDLVAGTTTRMSISAAGVSANGASDFPPRISADGSIVTFTSRATNLVANDTNNASDVFVREVADLSTLTLVSANPGTGNPANGSSSGAVISGNGKFVAFHSEATDLVTGDTNGMSDVFLYEISGGAIERVSIDVNEVEGNGHSYDPSLGEGGAFLSYRSNATNLVDEDTDPGSDVYLRDFIGNQTDLISVNSDEVKGDDFSFSRSGALSADGRYVVFSSAAFNLGGTSGGALISHLYRRDRQTGETECLTDTTDGIGPNTTVLRESISADGTTVVFDSHATNLVIADANGSFSDVYASPGTDLTPLLVAKRTALEKQIRASKKKLKIAQRKNQAAKVKRFKKQIRSLTLQLRGL